VPVIPDDNPEATSVFTLKDIEKGLRGHKQLSEDEIVQTLKLISEGVTPVFVYEGRLMVVSIASGLYHVYEREQR
jgi:hypothetical protein